MTQEKDHRCTVSQGTVRTVDSKGEPVSYGTEIRVGDAHEAYVYIEPAVGDATKSAIAQLLGGTGMTRGVVEKLPLRFHHGSHHFAHGTGSHAQVLRLFSAGFLGCTIRIFVAPHSDMRRDPTEFDLHSEIAELIEGVNCLNEYILSGWRLGVPNRFD